MPTIAAAERLDVQVLVDNVTDTLSSTPAFVIREQQVLRRNGMLRASGAAMCCANHGLSLVITAHTEGGPRTLLFDAGPVDYAVVRNGARLGVDFAAVEAVVLSHGHWDHAGGLLAAFDLIHTANGGRTVPCHLHPGMFAERGMRQPDGGVFPMDFIPTPETLAAHGATPVVSAEPQAPLDGTFYLSGEIPRRTAVRTRPARPGAPDRGRTLGARPAADGRTLPRRPRARQGGGRVLRLLPRRHRQRAARRARGLPGRDAACGDGGLPSLGRERGDHSRNGARPRRLRPRGHRPRPLHRLARGECAGTRLWRRRGGAGRGRQTLHIRWHERKDAGDEIRHHDPRPVPAGRRHARAPEGRPGHRAAGRSARLRFDPEGIALQFTPVPERAADPVPRPGRGAVPETAHRRRAWCCCRCTSRSTSPSSLPRWIS